MFVDEDAFDEGDAWVGGMGMETNSGGSGGSSFGIFVQHMLTLLLFPLYRDRNVARSQEKQVDWGQSIRPGVFMDTMFGMTD